MDERDQTIAKQLKRRCVEAAGDRFVRLIVFGSRTTGDADHYSDLDVVVLVRNRTPELESVLDELAYDTMWDYDFSPIISLKVLDADQFDKNLAEGYSFYENVAREGITF